MAKAIAQYTIVALADGSGGITTSDTAPTSPKLNDLWLNTTNNTLYIYNGTDWVTQQSQVVVS